LINLTDIFHAVVISPGTTTEASSGILFLSGGTSEKGQGGNVDIRGGRSGAGTGGHILLGKKSEDFL